MASSAYAVTVQANGHEKNAYKAIKDYILALDSRITCPNDPDDEFDYSTKGNDHIATLNFYIGNQRIFKFYRPSALRDGSSNEIAIRGIMFSMDGVDGIPANTREIWFVTNGYDDGRAYKTQSTDEIRGLCISHAVNDYFIYASFASIRDERVMRYQYNASVLHCLSNNKAYISSNTVGNPYNKTTVFNISGYYLYDVETLSSGTFLSRFLYACPPGKIDYIKSCIYQSSGEKAFENRAIYDCTTVTAGDTVSLKDGAYLAVGSHQLVRVN